MRKSPARAPITMPAIAPPEGEELDEVGAVEAAVDVGVEEASVEVASEVDGVAEVALVLAVGAAELRVDEVLVEVLKALDSEPPRTCASRTTPTLDVQQSLAVPQHHRSLVAVPSQGVIGVFPNTFLVCWQTSRQPVAETSLFVQKSTHWAALAWLLCW